MGPPRLACRHGGRLPSNCPSIRPASRLTAITRRHFSQTRRRGFDDQRPPVVSTRTLGSGSSTRESASSSPEDTTVPFPYIRICLGVLFCGTLIFSMSNILGRRRDSIRLLESSRGGSGSAGGAGGGSSIADLDSTTKRESGVTASSPMRLRMESFIKEQQSEIVAALEALDPNLSSSYLSSSPSQGNKKFRTDTWTRPNGGGGISCVLQDGTIFEKAGVNISTVYGTLPRPAIEKMRVNHKALDPDVDSLEFFATGLSCVIHPTNPNAPTVHFNYRYFETMDREGKANAWWFGGGTDLTPSYLFDEDAIHFHRSIKDACDKHDRSYYPRFKKWCDKYFYIPHRGETRGVGGIFFDDLDEGEKDQEQLFAFVKDSLLAFLPSYMPIIQRRKDLPFTPREKDWQQLRRGRYVEFNLVHDRGTSFGLNTPGARVESILMSLPLTARWEYMHEVEKGGREERLLGVLKEPREWV